jgi:hypothetical protein
MTNDPRVHLHRRDDRRSVELRHGQRRELNRGQRKRRYVHRRPDRGYSQREGERPGVGEAERGKADRGEPEPNRARAQREQAYWVTLTDSDRRRHLRPSPLAIECGYRTVPAASERVTDVTGLQ